VSNDQGRRHIEKHGHNVVLKAWAQGGKDAYGDATLTATNSTLKAIREMDARRSGIDRDASGAVPTGDVIFYFPQEIWPSGATVASTVSVSDGSGTQASEIVDDGSTYTAIQKDKLDNGILVVVTERNRA